MDFSRPRVLLIVGPLAVALTVTGLVIGGPSGHHSMQPNTHATPSGVQHQAATSLSRTGDSVHRGVHASRATNIAATKIASPGGNRDDDVRAMLASRRPGCTVGCR